MSSQIFQCVSHPEFYIINFLFVVMKLRASSLISYL